MRDRTRHFATLVAGALKSAQQTQSTLDQESSSSTPSSPAPSSTSSPEHTTSSHNAHNPRTNANTILYGSLLSANANASPFHRHARAVLRSIGDLHEAIEQVLPRYVDTSVHRVHGAHDSLSESEKDAVDVELTSLMHTCRSRIAALSQHMDSPAQDDSAHSHQLLHQHGVVHILETRLQRVFARFAHSKQLRLKRLLEREQTTLKVHVSPPNDSNPRQHGRSSPSSLHNLSAPIIQLDPHIERQLESSGILEQLQEENDALVDKLSSRLDQVTHIQQQVQQISALQELFETNVLEQKGKIEQLQQDAHKQTELVRDAHKQFNEASKNLRSFRLCFLVMFIILSVSLLFLDWVSP